MNRVSWKSPYCKTVLFRAKLHVTDLNHHMTFPNHHITVVNMSKFRSPRPSNTTVFTLTQKNLLELIMYLHSLLVTYMNYISSYL